MGRSKGTKKKLRTKPESISHLTTETLLSRMQEKIDSFQYEEAQKYCQEALKRSPDDITVLESAGSLCLELGEEERARHCYGRAITLCPEEGHSKYFTMAQLLTHKESLQYYLKGIEILVKVVNAPKTKANSDLKTDSAHLNGLVNGSSIESEPSSSSSTAGDSKAKVESKGGDLLARELSAAFCSVAELFMTDLCDEDEAEEAARKNIENAIKADPQNPEAYQHMASFLLVKQEPQEAKDYIKKSLNMWLPDFTALDEGKAQPGTFDPVDTCPLSYDARLSTSRILIEVAEYESACTVLDGLLLEDDQIIDTWYLLGWNSYLQGDEHKAESKYYLQKALELKDLSSPDSQIIKHVEELLVELKDVVEETPKNLEEQEVLLSDSEDEEMMDVT